MAWTRARSHTRPRASTAASAALVLLLWRSDTYVVAALLSTRQLGVYAVGVSVAEVTQVTLSGLRAALTPRLRPLGDEDLPVAVFARLNQVALLLLALVGLVLALVGRRLFDVVYGADFGRAAAVALILLPGMWGFVTVTTYLETLQISGEGRFLVSALSGALLTNVVINLTLARRYGLVLPAASSSICYLGLGLLTVRKASRAAAVPIGRLLWPHPQPS
jgi:O-antigen/teichoic acid export membrane protein